MCSICGNPEAYFRSGNRGLLCNHCAKTTPEKLNRESFGKAYWGEESNTVNESIKREFYSDYLCSQYDIAGYISATSEESY